MLKLFLNISAAWIPWQVLRSISIYAMRLSSQSKDNLLVHVLLLFHGASSMTAQLDLVSCHLQALGIYPRSNLGVFWACRLPITSCALCIESVANNRQVQRSISIVCNVLDSPELTEHGHVLLAHCDIRSLKLQLMFVLEWRRIHANSNLISHLHLDMHLLISFGTHILAAVIRFPTNWCFHLYPIDRHRTSSAGSVSSLTQWQMHLAEQISATTSGSSSSSTNGQAEERLNSSCGTWYWRCDRPCARIVQLMWGWHMDRLGAMGIGRVPEICSPDLRQLQVRSWLLDVL